MNRGKLRQLWSDHGLTQNGGYPCGKNWLGVACAGGSAGLALVAMKAEECSDIWPLLQLTDEIKSAQENALQQ